MQQTAISGYCDNTEDIYNQIRNVSGARIAVVEIPNVDNLTLCSFTYWMLKIRMSNVQSPIRNVLHVALSHTLIAFTISQKISFTYERQTDDGRPGDDSSSSVQ